MGMAEVHLVGPKVWITFTKKFILGFPLARTPKTTILCIVNLDCFIPGSTIFHIPFTSVDSFKPRELTLNSRKETTVVKTHK